MPLESVRTNVYLKKNTLKEINGGETKVRNKFIELLCALCEKLRIIEFRITYLWIFYIVSNIEVLMIPVHKMVIINIDFKGLLRIKLPCAQKAQNKICVGTKKPYERNMR